MSEVIYRYEYSPLKLENIQLSEEMVRSEEYFFQYDRDVIYKFMDNYNAQDQQYNYLYTPSNINVSCYQKFTDGSKQLVTGTIKVSYYYLDKDSSMAIKTQTFNNVYQAAINFTDSENDGINVKSLNLQYLKIEFILNESVLIADTLYVNWGTSEQMAKLVLNATNLMAAIDSTKLIFDTDGLSVYNGGFKIYNEAGEPVFYVNKSGSLSFEGEITTGAGSIGGWQILTNELVANNGVVGMHSGNSMTYKESTDPIRFWAGKSTNDYNFVVTQNGRLYAHSADVEGIIKASSGYIQNSFLVGNEDRGILLFGGSDTDESFISSAVYNSGAFGYGWKLYENGSAEFSNITARGKITSTVFEHGRISSVGGSLYIAPTIYAETQSSPIESTGEANKYKTTWTLPYSSLNNINERSWQINDIIKLDGEITYTPVASVNEDGDESSPAITSSVLKLSNVDGQITAAEGNPVTVTITFEYTKLPSTQLVGQVFNPGSVIILYGTNNRRHGLYMTAENNDSPFLDVYDDSENNTVKPAVRLGNLSGIVDANFYGGVLSGYGLYSSNAYLRGQLVLPNAGITNQKTIGYDGGNYYFELTNEEDDDNLMPQDNAIRIWAGGAMPAVKKDEDGNYITQEIAPFIVTQDGSLYAKKGIFQGIIKATDSEFSGSIKAAGIVIKPGGTGENAVINNDHFFVAYTNSPSSFSDYVLDINSEGLQIWEGGLRAYSDWASGENDANKVLPIYGYSDDNPQPQPYFMLADDGKIPEEASASGEIENTAVQLNARMAASRGHFFTIEKKNDQYQTNSIVINDGIWFGRNGFSTLIDIESAAYYKVLNIGINLDDSNVLNINNTDSINFKTNKSVFIKANDSQVSKLYDDALCVSGNIRLMNTDNNIIRFGDKLSIVEARKENTVVGFDFIILE